MDITVRIMQPEMINQGNNKSFLYKLHEAKWNLLIRRNQTTSTVRMDRWTIIYPSKHESVAKNVYQTLHKVAKPMGLYIYICSVRCYIIVFNKSSISSSYI